MRLRSLAASAVLALGGVLVVAAPAWAHPVLHIAASPTTVVAGHNTTITISGTSNGNYSGARIDVSSTGGPGTLPSFTTFVSCSGGPTCSEVGSVYRMALPTLTNGQAFSYSITLTVDAATAATTFTTKAQFYKSDNTTDGPTTGPVITVTHPTADLAVYLGNEFVGPATLFNYTEIAQNISGDSVPATVTLTVTQSATILTPTGAGGGGFTCTIVGSGFSCTAPLLTAGSSAEIDAYFDFSILAIGTLTITTTISSTASDPVPGNNTDVFSCSVLTGLITSC